MKKLIIILMLLIAATSWADVSGKLDSLRVMIYEQSLVPSTGTDVVTDAITNRIVNRAIQKVCIDFPAIEKFDTVISVAGTRHYALNSDFSRLKAIFKSTTDDDLKNVYTLSFPPVETWFEAKGGEVGGLPNPQNKPEPRYAWAFNDRIYFYPTPSSADTLAIAYYAIDRQLTGGDSVTNVLPEFREAVIWYGAYLLAVRRGDYDRGGICRQTYLDMVNEQKAGVVSDKK